MSTIGSGPSQAFKDLVTKTKEQNGSEKANFVNKNESQQIREKLVEETKGMSEKDAKVYMKEAETYLKSELVGTTNIKNASIKGVSDGSMDLGLDTEFEVSIEGEEAKSENSVNTKVTDYEATAASDPNDKQFQILNKSKSNFIEYNPENGAIKGINVASTKLEAFSGNMKDVIMNDFAKYANPPLKTTFPNNEQGVKDLKESLGKLSGAKQPIQDTDVKELLSYVHKGTGSDGKVNVKNLQNLLENLSGDIGTQIRGKNTPTGGDNKYGYATTLQVRSLAGAISEVPAKNFVETGKISIKDDPELSKIKKWIIVGDSSGSMQNKLDVFGKLFEDKTIFNPDSKFSIGAAQDYKEKTRDLGTNLNTKEAAKVLSKEQGNFKSHDGDMSESGLTMALQKLQNAPKVEAKDQPAAIMIVTDAKEQNANTMKDVIAKAKEKGYNQLNIASLAGESGATQNTMISIDLKDDKQVNALMNQVEKISGVNRSEGVIQNKEDKLINTKTELLKELSTKQAIFNSIGKPMPKKESELLSSLTNDLKQAGKTENISIASKYAEGELEKIKSLAQRTKRDLKDVAEPRLNKVDGLIDGKKDAINMFNDIIKEEKEKINVNSTKEGTTLNWLNVANDPAFSGTVTNFTF